MLSLAAPEQRPPQPIMPIFTSCLPAACAARASDSPPRAAAPVAEALRKSRRVALSDRLSVMSVSPVLFRNDFPISMPLAFHRAGAAPPSNRRHFQIVDDALDADRIARQLRCLALVASLGTAPRSVAMPPFATLTENDAPLRALSHRSRAYTRPSTPSRSTAARALSNPCGSVQPDCGLPLEPR